MWEKGSDVTSASELPGSGGDVPTRLRRAGSRLFWTKGYSATSTRELADAVGIQKASLYHHMDSKEDLLYSICVRSLDGLYTTSLESVKRVSDPLDRLRALIKSHVVNLLSDREEHATTLTQRRCLTAGRREEVDKLCDRYQELVRGLVGEAQRSGDVSDERTSTEFALCLLNLMNWTIFWYQTEGQLSPEDLAEMFESVYFGGVLSPPGGPSVTRDGRAPGPRTRVRNAEPAL